MVEVCNDDGINVVVVTATSIEPTLSFILGLYDMCIKDIELFLGNDTDCCDKLSRDMKESEDITTSYENVCNHQKVIILTRCISSLKLLLARFNQIRLNESISKSRSFEKNQQGSVKSSFQERVLLFIYSPVTPSFTGNLCCACYNNHNSTD